MRNLLYLFFIGISIVSAEIKTLSMRPFIENPEDYSYSRGRYLIILGNNAFSTMISSEEAYGDFVNLKKSQGYDVDVEIYSSISPSNSATELKDWLEDYSDTYPLLEYVLLVGDVSNNAAIATFQIPSYNEPEQDATDYPYTFFSEMDMYNPRFFIGRWSVDAVSELLNLKGRTIKYQSIQPTDDLEYLNKALLVAGSYKTDAGAVPVPDTTWPLTPYWTSLWIQDELESNTFMEVDTALFHINNQNTTTTDVINPWNEGIGIVNYRGWGNATGWTKPEFKLDDINDITNYENLPVVWSFVCNTGDFGNDTNPKCLGEKLTISGNADNPQGAVAVIAPSDLDTDTRFNNVLCGQMWDEMIEGRIYELAPILHAGKQAVAKEFEDLEVSSVNGGTMSIPKFYHHVYSVLGDPSLSVWFGEPSEMNHSLANTTLMQSHISLTVTDEEGIAIQDVVGALIDSNGDLIAKGTSNESGLLNIDFSDVENGTELDLYLNAPQFFQKKIELIFQSDDGSDLADAVYNYNVIEPIYTNYSAISSIDDSDDAPVYDWIEINSQGTDLELQDDTHTRIPIGFNFTYFDQVYDSITVCSNGWVSLEPCTINHFWNFSIPFPMGPNALIAPFMDDLDDNVGTEPFKVYSHLDIENDQLIIQWDNVANGEDDEFCGTEQDCTRETFQLILKDGGSQNGDILFQYKEIHDIDENGNYSTIGIESPDQNFGYQYQFRNISYGSQLVQNEMAILFTTNSDDTFLSVDESILPSQLRLFQNFPNPFNPTTNISFFIDKLDVVNMSIFDLNGKEVYKIIDNQFYSEGQYTINIDGAELSSGLYFYQIKSGKDIQSKKMLLLK